MDNFELFLFMRLLFLLHVAILDSHYERGVGQCISVTGHSSEFAILSGNLSITPKNILVIICCFWRLILMVSNYLVHHYHVNNFIMSS